MIYFEKIRYKNFLSFGNQFTEINFRKSPTTLVVGENGAGKSSLLDAITFVLYGKPFRKITKPQMVNTINGKDCVVEIEFTINENQYLVRRGIKPNIFEVYENNELVNQDASGRDYQDTLERHVLKMNYTAFTQIVVLGKATYVPFMRLKTNERRQLIEELLGLKIFSKMNDVLKRNASILKEELNSAESAIDVLESKMEMTERYINDIQQDKTGQINRIEKDIEENEAHVAELTKKQDEITQLRDKLMEQLDGKDAAESKQKKLENFSYEFGNKIKKLKKDIKFFMDNDICPTCNQEITDEFRESEITAKQGKIDEFDQMSAKVEDEINGVQEKLNQYQSVIKKVREHDLELQGVTTSIREIARFISGLRTQLEEVKNSASDVTEQEEKLKELEDALNIKRTTKSKLMDERSYYSNIGMMLKDTGIKAVIVQKYLPIFNNLINQYLTKMGFFVKFNLDTEFNESILSRYRDSFSYSSFSEGEKLRIDLAILLTWRELAKIKNSLNTNLLIMDEIFDSSLDQTGVDSFIELIPEMENANIFVISHTPDKLTDKFRSQITFQKDRNFSIIS